MTETWTCRCGRTVFRANRENHLERKDGGPHGEPSLYAVETAIRAARQEMANRYDDLRWCNKADLCHEKAEGAALALSDFDDVMASAGFDFRPLAPVSREERNT